MKIKIEYQHDSMQCGVACLQMVCNYFGANYSLDEISKNCFATTQGVSMLGINMAANALGIETNCVRANIDELSRNPLPAILHWDQNHFVVLHKVRNGKKFYIADPGNGLVTYKLDEFMEHWCSDNTNGVPKGIVMFMETTPKFFDKLKERCYASKEKLSFNFLLGYIKKYRKDFCWTVLALIVGSVIQIAMPFLTQSIVDIGINNKDIDFIWLVLLGQLMLTISRTAVDFVRSWLLMRISIRITLSLVSDFFIKLLKLPMSFFDTKLLGDIMQRMSDHSRVNTFLTQQTLNITFAAITFFVFSIVLLTYNIMVFGIFILGSLLYGCWIAIFMRSRKLLDYELFKLQSGNTNKTYEFISSMQEIKLQDCEQRKRIEWEETQNNVYNVQMKSLKLQQSQQAGSVFINEVKNIIITILAATAVINGEMTLGMMLAVQYIIGQLNSPIEQLLTFFNSIQDVKISLERINEIHQMEDEDEKKELKMSYLNQKFGIQINSIMFKYDPHALKKTIDNVDIKIPHGKVTAIVGASGSGKTTLLRLLLGYYPVLEGNIMIGGQDINCLNKKWWRRQCGVVMQDGIIFSESIERNIATNDSEVDQEKLMIAAETACIKDYIISLPLKFGTKIGRDGIGLSQGQKQRILIARAVYKNPDYIFLDEATNSLDANNERFIVEKLNKFFKGKTVIIVAHRLSTVKNADQIIVLDQGKVVEIGNHESLTAKKGAYYNLVKNQLELGN